MRNRFSLSGKPLALAARRAFAGIAIAFSLAAPSAVMALDDSNGELQAASVDQLKRAYLACDRAAVDGRLSSASVMQCSVVYEKLKERAFGGDFEKLRAWSRANPSVRNTAQ